MRSKLRLNIMLKNVFVNVSQVISDERDVVKRKISFNIFKHDGKWTEKSQYDAFDTWTVICDALMSYCNVLSLRTRYWVSNEISAKDLYASTSSMVFIYFIRVFLTWLNIFNIFKTTKSVHEVSDDNLYYGMMSNENELM